jgi:uncharacterized protein (DUF983 family)
MKDDRAHWPPVDPFRAGLGGRCPRCGEGLLFSGFLAVAPQCPVCGLDNSFADSGDGPVAFVVLLIGFVVVGLALWMEVTIDPPLWVHFMIWVPLAIVLSLAALRLIKGLLITLQYRNRAAEGRLDDRS